MTRHAPVVTDAERLAVEVHAALRDSTDPVAARLVVLAVELVEALTLAALADVRGPHLAAADALLLRLRVGLRLAEPMELLPDRQVVHLLQQADAIGRQLGGWRRATQR